MRRGLLVLAALGALTVLPLLFLRWFDAGRTFAMLHGDRPGVVLEPTAWDASGASAALLALLAVVVAAAAAAAGRGWFFAWTVGAAGAGAGGLLALVVRLSPPTPPRATYVTGAQAYDPTAVPIAAMAAFAVALAALTAWALLARRTL